MQRAAGESKEAMWRPSRRIARKRPHLLDEIFRIKIAHVRDARAQPVEMRRHGVRGPCRIACLDGLDDGGVLSQHARHPSRHGQGQPPIAVDLNLDLLDQGPDSRMARKLRDLGGKGLVSRMDALAIACPLHATLSLGYAVE